MGTGGKGYIKNAGQYSWEKDDLNMAYWETISSEY